MLGKFSKLCCKLAISGVIPEEIILMPFILEISRAIQPSFKYSDFTYMPLENQVLFSDLVFTIFSI